MSYNGIGGAARGSGSSGYVQSNRAGAVQPGVYEQRQSSQTSQDQSSQRQSSPKQIKKPIDQAILDHQRARAIEAALCDYEDQLEDSGRSSEEIAKLIKTERARLEREHEPTGRQSRVEYHQSSQAQQDSQAQDSRAKAKELDY